MRRLLATFLLLWPVAGQGQGHKQAAYGTVGPVRSAVLDAVDAADAADAVGPAVLGAGVVVRGVEPGSEAPPSVALLRTPAGAFAASLVLPGAGQAALGLRRWLAYAALEAVVWGVHLEAAADVRRLQGAYRDLAWDAARVPTGPAAREDGSWGYYETVSAYVSSGRYDLEPATPGLQPETDLGTYNGDVWDLARGLYLPGGTGVPSSPEYQDALGYYQEQAAGPDFLWDWTGQADALERYRGLIADTDGEARVRSAALGLVLANHLVAAVDALVVARLRSGEGVRLESHLLPARNPRLDITLKFPTRE